MARHKSHWQPLAGCNGSSAGKSGCKFIVWRWLASLPFAFVRFSKPLARLALVGLVAGIHHRLYGVHHSACAPFPFPSKAVCNVCRSIRAIAPLHRRQTFQSGHIHTRRGTSPDVHLSRKWQAAAWQGMRGKRRKYSWQFLHAPPKTTQGPILFRKRRSFSSCMLPWVELGGWVVLIHFVKV